MFNALNIKNKVLIRKPTLSLIGLIAFFLAISPITDPYIIAEVGSGVTVRINDLLLIGLCVLFLSIHRKFSLKYMFLLFWCLMFLLLTLLAAIGIDKNLDYFLSLKNIFIWTFYSVSVGILWQGTDRDTFFKYVTYVALFATIVVVWQFVAGHAGIKAWDGRLPGISLSKYDGWAGYVDKNTGDIRPCGIFQESSYVGVYCLVAYAYSIINNRLNVAFILAGAMFMSSSMVAVIGCITVTIYLIVMGKNLDIDFKTTKRLMIFTCVAIIAFILLITYSESIRSTFLYVQRRVTSIDSDLHGERMGSTKLRLLGNVDKFSNYPLWQKLFGVGAAQYANYFGVKPYSNNFVTTLLDYGLVGTACFLVCLFCLHKKIRRSSRVYFLITLLIFASDRQWFNWYFFYMLTACVLQKSPLVNRVRKQ